MEGEVIVTTTPNIPGYSIERVIGIVTGSSVRTRGLGGKILAGIESVIGGRGKAYLDELEKARADALENLKENAKKMGANAVISVDFETMEVLSGFIVVTAYGTAAIARP